VDSKKSGWEGVDWIRLSWSLGKWQGFVNMVIRLWVLWNARTVPTKCRTIRFQRRIFALCV